MPPVRKALIFFSKLPRAGFVKTRLLPELTPEQANRIHLGFILDTLRSSRSMKGITRIISCDPTRRDPFFQRLAKQFRLVLMDQAGEDLGARMRNAFAEVRRRRFDAAIIVGTDCPTLPAEYIMEAFKLLRKHSLVLGPSIDGGYYLVGCTGEPPAIFDGIEWGTEHVLRQTLERISEKKMDAVLLPFWYDIDSFKDLRFLSEHLRYLERRTGKPVAPETSRNLRSLRQGIL
jgi:uncharacterized protein